MKSKIYYLAREYQKIIEVNNEQIKKIKSSSGYNKNNQFHKIHKDAIINYEQKNTIYRCFVSNMIDFIQKHQNIDRMFAFCENEIRTRYTNISLTYKIALLNDLKNKIEKLGKKRYI